MYYMIYAKDKENGLELRQQTRQAHIDYIRSQNIIEYAAPLVDEDDQMIGSLILIQANTREEAKNFVANDPYNKAGLFAQVTIERFKKP